MYQNINNILKLNYNFLEKIKLNKLIIKRIMKYNMITNQIMIKHFMRKSSNLFVKKIKKL